jgi:hypothetical protein
MNVVDADYRTYRAEYMTFQTSISFTVKVAILGFIVTRNI